MLSSSLFKMKFRQTLLHYAVATCLYCFHIYDLCWDDRRWRIGHIKSKAHWLSRNKRNDTWQISQRSECDHCEWKILHWFAISSSNRKVAWLNKLKFRLVIFLSLCFAIPNICQRSTWIIQGKILLVELKRIYGAWTMYILESNLVWWNI